MVLPVGARQPVDDFTVSVKLSAFLPPCSRALFWFPVRSLGAGFRRDGVRWRHRVGVPDPFGAALCFVTPDPLWGETL